MLTDLLKRKEKEKSQYKWQQQNVGETKDYMGYKLLERWGFNFNPEAKKASPPYSHSEDYHGGRVLFYEISVLDPMPYKRPTMREIISKDESEKDENGVITITTKEKEIFLHPYDGLIDARLSLEDDDGLEIWTIGEAYFLNGGLVAGSGPPNQTPINSLEEYKASLNTYFNVYENFDISNHLPNFFLNSNLPEEVRQRFSCLL